MQYIWLALLWLLFGVLHSILAAAKVKRWLIATMKAGYKYYRPAYSLFALINLVIVAWYHISIPTLSLWAAGLAQKATAIVLIVPALLVMAASIRKYFLNLSGIDVFLKQRPAAPLHLEQTGLHRYMRHPLYSGTLLFVWGIFLWQSSLANLVSCSCITAYTVIGAYFEEKKLLASFGEAYRVYTKKVPMLLPGIK